MHTRHHRKYLEAMGVQRPVRLPQDCLADKFTSGTTTKAFFKIEKSAFAALTSVKLLSLSLSYYDFL